MSIESLRRKFEAERGAPTAAAQEIERLKDEIERLIEKYERVAPKLKPAALQRRLSDSEFEGWMHSINVRGVWDQEDLMMLCEMARAEREHSMHFEATIKRVEGLKRYRVNSFVDDPSQWDATPDDHGDFVIWDDLQQALKGG